MDPTKPPPVEPAQTRAKTRAAEQLNSTNTPFLASSSGPHRQKNGNNDGSLMQGPAGISSRGGEAHRGRPLTRGGQQPQNSTCIAGNTMEANPSTPVRRSGLGFGYTSFDSPASGVSSNGFARPQSYCEGVSTISCRSQSASPSKSSASSAKTYKLKKSRSQSPVKSIKTQLTNTQLTMASLRICCPSITQRSLDDACRVDGASMPPAVHVFMNKLPRGTQGFIPVSLRVS